MSIETSHLALRLEGPLQSWGFSSQFNRRNTGLMPTKSAILGMCCAALGIARGSEEEKEQLARSASLRFLAIAIPRCLDFGENRLNLPVRRISDYHTVGGGYDRSNPIQRLHIPLTADGKPKAEGKQTVVTYRQYLCDSRFAGVLCGDAELVSELEHALKDPVWGIYLGRKSCIPTAPVCAGVFSSEEAALNTLLNGRALDAFTHQREVERFEDGTDFLSDQPLSFAAPDGIRKFAHRRVKLIESRE